jgi:hypothetical protein
LDIGEDMATKKPSLFRWLTQELGMCSTQSKRFAGLTPARAWKKATPDQKYRVMGAVGIPHYEPTCPLCTKTARANKFLPVLVLKSFRKWQRATASTR